MSALRRFLVALLVATLTLHAPPQGAARPMNRFARQLTDAQFEALPLISQRFPLVGAYYCDVVHVHETKPFHNHGPEIDAWCKRLKLGSGGIPWCGVFVTVCLLDAGYQGPLPENPAWTHGWANWAKAKGYAQPAGTKPRRGDIVVLLLGPKTGHMFIALGDTDGDGLCDSLEGNTNDDGGREGWEVARRDRKLVAGPSCVVIRLPEPKP